MQYDFVLKFGDGGDDVRMPAPRNLTAWDDLTAATEGIGRWRRGVKIPQDFFRRQFAEYVRDGIGIVRIEPRQE